MIADGANHVLRNCEVEWLARLGDAQETPQLSATVLATSSGGIAIDAVPGQ